MAITSATENGYPSSDMKSENMKSSIYNKSSDNDGPAGFLFVSCNDMSVNDLT